VGASRRTLGITFVVALGALAACSDADRIVGPPPVVADTLTLDVALQELGFSTEGLIDLGADVLVEGDIRMSKASIMAEAALARLRRADDPRGVRFQWFTNALVDDNHISVMRVDLSRLPSEWQTAAREAITQWNQSGASGSDASKVNFYEAQPGDIVLESDFCDGVPGGAVGCAGFPANGAPFNRVGLETSFGFTAVQRRNLVTHELGHTIGFRHSNVVPGCNSGRLEDTTNATLAPGTPRCDNGSVMVWAGQNNGVNANDRTALRHMYPPATTWMTYAFTPGLSLSWGTITGVAAYRLFQGHWYKYQDWETGEWRWAYSYGPVWEGTATSYYDPWATDRGDTSCGQFYEIRPVYPGGKLGAPAASVNELPTCTPSWPPD
jgi:hypothetical protein